MHELWGVDSYRKQNRYCSTACIMDLIKELPDSEEKHNLMKTQDRLTEIYASLADMYHEEKGANEKNSLVMG